jgi:hypothetical protein
MDMMDDDLKPYFLAADVRLYAPDVSLLIAPDGAMYHIEREPDALRALLARCNGTTTVADLVGDDPTTRDILDALHESGCLTLHPHCIRRLLMKPSGSGLLMTLNPSTDR